MVFIKHTLCKRAVRSLTSICIGWGLPGSSMLNKYKYLKKVIVSESVVQW